MSFFSTVIPVIMRQNEFSLSTIGLLQLIKLPWLIKFMWAPLVDRHTPTMRSYKRWIIYSEIFYAMVIFVVAGLNFETDLLLIVILILLSFVASATQDIATDAFAVVSFKDQDKSMVNSMQSMGSFAGTLIGSGVLLLLYKEFGWGRLLPMLSLFVLLALIPLCNMYRRKKPPIIIKRNKAKWADVVLFFGQKNIWNQIGFLLLFYSGIIGILAMLKPFMVDLGYDIKQIGFISGIVGTSAACLSAFVGGKIMRRIGHFGSRLLFASLITLVALYFLIISQQPVISLGMIYGGVIMLWSVYGMATIVVYTTAMDCVRQGCEGIDFTLQTVLTHLSGMVMAIVSGRLADSFGYGGLYLFEVVLGLSTVAYIIVNFRPQKMQHIKCKDNG